MQWTGLNELREKFLSFFESKGHTRLKSYPLIPQGDNSLLLINSGMAPMKKFFLGQEVPPNKRVTTCQKCIRTPDIENVGKTARHGTYFEMLGNFSFGDYFKHEATEWAWEFVTKELELPIDRIWVSIYQDDDEAFEIWTKERGVDPSHIVRMGKEDNFWEIGSGPCGPCSELYFDRGEDKGCGSPDCRVGCECDRFVEFWNLVFSQFNGDGEGHYEPMEHPNIDTGMGLERLACIMQEVDNLFEVDTVQNIMNHISEIAGVKYKQDPKVDVCLRVITDHIRSTTFMIGDGVIPSNEGRGYVLRRLLRRAARNGKQLGIRDPFLYKVVDTVIAENKSAYPELEENADYIKKIVRAEEENFAKTIDKGMELLNNIIDGIDSNMESKILSGEQAFKLYDTYGFPIDLIKEIISEQGIDVDEARFRELMNEQKTRAREAKLNSDTVGWSSENYHITDEPTEFVGYETYECDAKLLHILTEDGEAEEAKEGDRVNLVFDRTPFYAESGGQVGDRGVFVIGNSVVNILDCQKDPSGQHSLHLGLVMAGSIQKGVTGHLSIDGLKRDATARNHTAAHLLQKALRDELGSHVHQAGQLVDSERLRFDFNHFEAMTPQELLNVEQAVNAKILEAVKVTTSEMDIESARAQGAMALFGEKYGDIVRVVDADGYSVELCGGTHVDNTSKLGLFKIISESSAAAGIRRIEATTGTGVLGLMQEGNLLIAAACGALKVTNPHELPARCKALNDELKAKDRKIDELNQKIASTQMQNVFDTATEVNGVRVISASFNGMTVQALRAMGDRIKENPLNVAVLANIADGKGNLIAVCGKEAVARGAHAGNIVREIAALAGGKGGGRPDSAMAGVTEIFQIDEALTQLTSVVQKFVK